MIRAVHAGGTDRYLARDIAAKLKVACGQSCIVEERGRRGRSVGCDDGGPPPIPTALTMMWATSDTMAIQSAGLSALHGYAIAVKGWTPLAYVARDQRDGRSRVGTGRIGAGGAWSWP